MFKNAFHGSVLLKKSYSLRLTDTGYSRYVIRLVAHEPLEVDELLRCQVVSFLHCSFIIDVKFAHSALVYKHVDTWAYKLQPVLVTADYEGSEACFGTFH